MISISIPLIISRFIPSFFYVRYYIFTHLAWVLLTALAIRMLPRVSVRVVMVSIFIFFTSGLIADYYAECVEKSVMRANYEYVAKHFRDGDVVIHENGWTFGPSYFYHGGTLDEYFLTDEFGIPSQWHRQLEPRVIRKFKRMWLFPESPERIHLLRSQKWFRDLSGELIERGKRGYWYLFELP
jgi:hypothetical protein